MLVSKKNRLIIVIVAVICHVISLILFLAFSVETESQYRWDTQVYVLLIISLLLSLTYLFVTKATGITALNIFRFTLLIILGLPLGRNLHVVEIIIFTSILVSVGLSLQLLWNILFSILFIAVFLLFQVPVSAVGADIEKSTIQNIVMFGLLSSLVSFLSCYANEKMRSIMEQKTIISRLRRAIDKISNINIDIQDYAVTAGRESRIIERKEISREIHDSAGYILTTLLMMLKTGLLIVPEGSGELKQLLAKAVKQAEEGIVEIRRAVHELRKKRIAMEKGINAINKLISVFSDATCVEVKTEYGNVPNTLGPETDLFVYRFVQEGLLNAFKHGNADAITVYFWDTGSMINVVLSDNGNSSKKVEKGIGILGMEERAAKLGGHITISARTDGFEIRASIPKKESLR
jgi:signal transduction histidine kinase